MRLNDCNTCISSHHFAKIVQPMPSDAPLRRLARATTLLLPVLLQTLLLAGCAGGAVGTLANAALQLAGVAKPPAELPDAQKPPRNVSIRLHAAQRWRATFAAADAERTGITVGLHACALSVSGVAGMDSAMAPLAALRCQ